MVKVVYKTIMTCDFCGKEFDPGKGYPQSPSGEFAVFNLSLSFYVPSGIPGPFKVFGEDSPNMGRASGHMCGECIESISKKIGFNKAKGETDGERPVEVPGKDPGDERQAERVFSHA